LRWRHDYIEADNPTAALNPVKVDSSMLGREIEGMTDRSFNLHASGTFQRTVMR
jgi:hypothetical protein